MGLKEKSAKTFNRTYRRAGLFALALPLISCGSVGIAPKTTTKGRIEQQNHQTKIEQPPKPEKIVFIKPRLHLIRTFEEAREVSLHFRKLHPEQQQAPEIAERNAELGKGLQERVIKINEFISANWMTEGYLGPDLFERFQKYRPFTIFQPELRVDGIYHRNSNLIEINPFSLNYFTETPCKATRMIQETFKREEKNEACEDPKIKDEDLFKLVTHEQHHYASYTGRGDTYNIFVRTNEKKVKYLSGYLDEGVTEFFAQRMVREHRHVPSEVAYPMAVATMFYLDHLIRSQPDSRDDGTLRDAYFYGDFTQVSRMVDSVLGDGTFRGLIHLDFREYDGRLSLGPPEAASGIGCTRSPACLLA